MSLSSVLALRHAAALLKDPKSRQLEAESILAMKQALSTVLPELHEIILERLVQEVVADRLGSVLLLSSPSQLKAYSLRFREIAGKKRVRSTLNNIVPAFREKILLSLLEEIRRVPSTFTSSLVAPPLTLLWSMLPPTPHSTLQIKPTLGVKRTDTAFRLLPSELRLQIFELALVEEWNGSVPAFVKALRCDKQLYAEAVETFFNGSRTFLLHKGNLWSFLDMPKKVLLTIHKIKIVLRDGIDDPRQTQEPSPNVSALCWEFRVCRNVREVTIQSSWGRGGFWPRPDYHYISKYLSGLKRLERISFTFPIAVFSRSLLHLSEAPPNNGYCGPVERCNQWLGTVGKTMEVRTWFSPQQFPEGEDMLTLIYHGNTCVFIEDSVRDDWVRAQPPMVVETWFWEADKGKFLAPVCLCEADREAHKIQKEENFDTDWDEEADNID